MEGTTIQSGAFITLCVLEKETALLYWFLFFELTMCLISRLRANYIESQSSSVGRQEVYDHYR